jgi:hypothetical protein
MRRVAIYVEGGVVNAVIVDFEDVVVDLVDADNMKADGKSREEITQEWENLAKECKYVAY